jgi:MFS family permease
MTGSSTKQAGVPRWSALQRWTLGVTSMASFMAGMDALVVTTALPTIHTDLGAATSALSWTVAAYALGFAAVVLGIWGAITGMAVAVAPLVGGAIVSGLAWRWIFWVNVPIGVAVLAAGLTRLARSPKVSARIDLAGMLLGAFAVGAVAYAVQEGPTVGWTSAQVLTAGIGGLVLAGATMAWERRCAYPMVPPGLLALTDRRADRSAAR